MKEAYIHSPTDVLPVEALILKQEGSDRKERGFRYLLLPPFLEEFCIRYGEFHTLAPDLSKDYRISTEGVASPKRFKRLSTNPFKKLELGISTVRTQGKEENALLSWIMMWMIVFEFQDE